MRGSDPYLRYFRDYMAEAFSIPKAEEHVMTRKAGLVATLAVLAGTPFAPQSHAKKPISPQLA